VLRIEVIITRCAKISGLLQLWPKRTFFYIFSTVFFQDNGKDDKVNCG